MKRYKRLYGLLLLVIFLLLMSACGPVLGSGGSSLSPIQVLQNSSNTMTQLKSAHFDLNVTGNLLANAFSMPTTATPAAGQVNVNVAGSGDEKLPDQQSLKVTIRQNVPGRISTSLRFSWGIKSTSRIPKASGMCWTSVYWRRLSGILSPGSM